ncbi:hypothetical protein K431DRAFT_281644 [Polychaeton citri CBS 116435]|uniref:Uncharacterized protein n=1 Tax=Polychaeton citri CBS 116435 TaxID=1314669 RepID=A0A9P4US69_9PEZI|nr:hypothetical protein K431DRAFT_281644 [Polychaeton citri CBS 116435]
MLDGLKEAPTTHDEHYARDVLALDESETEEALDEQLMAQAKELGLDLSGSPLAQLGKRESSKTLSSDYPRRSASISSKASQSTGLTSNFSDYSKDCHSGMTGGLWPRGSLSFRDYDAFVSRGKLDGRASMSFSPPTTPSGSVFSLPLSSPESSPKKHFRRIRGLSRLRLHKTDSSISLTDTCPHCPQNAASQRRAIHRLPCGHRLCTEGLRNTIKSATNSVYGAVPSCCGQPIPGSLVEHVTNQDEQAAMLNRLELWEERASLSMGSRRSSRAHPIAKPNPFYVMNRTVSDESRRSKLGQLPPAARKELDSIISAAWFQELREKQEGQRNRFIIWLGKWRSEQNAAHEQLRKDLRARHETAIEDLEDHHATALSEAEDKQVKAEADMRESHLKEKQDNATALKHMEAYCAGTYSTGEPHNRTVTDQDRTELDKTRRTRDQMDQKHASAINVLRGEQSRRIKLRAQRQEREVHDIRRRQRQEEVELDRECRGEVQKWGLAADDRKLRIELRWALQTRVLMKQRELHHGLSYDGIIPSLDWNVDPAELGHTGAGMGDAGAKDDAHEFGALLEPATRKTTQGSLDTVTSK